MFCDMLVSIQDVNDKLLEYFCYKSFKITIPCDFKAVNLSI